MIAVLGSRRIWIGAQARLVDSSDSLQAWADRRVRSDADIKWILGNFVEADNPNSNGHLFPLPGLQAAISTIQDKPLNMVHQANYVVGHYADAEFAELPPDDVRTSVPTTIIEALAAMYHQVFPDEYRDVQKAHDDGSLYFSMEAVSDTVSCPTSHGGCGGVYAFAGRRSPTYCAHINGATPICVDNPHFQAGALILPPVKPGWKRADITQIEAWLREHDQEAEALYAGLKAETPQLSDATLESLMAAVVGLGTSVEAMHADLSGVKKVVDVLSPVGLALARERMVAEVLPSR